MALAWTRNWHGPLTALLAIGWATSGLAQTTAPAPSPTAAPVTPVTAPGPDGSQAGPQALPEPRPIAPWQDNSFRSLVSPGLERFESDRDFQRYVNRTQAARHRWERRFGALIPPPRIAPGLLGFQDAEVPECSPDDPSCIDDTPQEIIVTASAARPNPVQSTPLAITSITNNQTANVDEGDIVKQIGNYLIVLQDGRIFSVDIGGDALRPADRLNVYRDGNDDGWYDEMLVEGNRILITSYSYDNDATEISVFQLDTSNGRLSRDGSFLISSDDYYSGDNYATRIVGDNLIIYTPYEADDLTDARGRPRIRPWMSEEERDALLEAGADEDRDPRLRGQMMMDADNIYRPVIPTVEPYIHSVTICALGTYRADTAPRCRVNAFAGPRSVEMFVTPTDIYLWVGAGWEEIGRNLYDDFKPCGPGRPDLRNLPPSAIYRMPINATTIGVIGIHGRPFDQFSMDSSGGYFRGLWSVSDPTCELDGSVPTAFTNIAMREFTESYALLRDRRHIPVPSVPRGQIRNRFAGDWLVYGSGGGGYDAIPDAPDEDDTPEKIAARMAERASTITILPVDRPSAAQTLTVGHNVIRIDRVGIDGMIVNGYRDHQGLTMSLIQLGPQASVDASTTLTGRFESEGRSHAFNAAIDLEGNGLLGVPTVTRRNGRYVWYSETSDVSFLSVTGGPQRSLTDIGPLLSSIIPATERVPDYECEVSCVDWYGNSRPIFTGGRIFALMETELVEGRVVEGRMTELRRVDILTVTPQTPDTRKP